MSKTCDRYSGGITDVGVCIRCGEEKGNHTIASCKSKEEPDQQRTMPVMLVTACGCTRKIAVTWQPYPPPFMEMPIIVGRGIKNYDASGLRGFPQFTWRMRRYEYSALESSQQDIPAYKEIVE